MLHTLARYYALRWPAQLWDLFDHHHWALYIHIHAEKPLIDDLPVAAGIGLIQLLRLQPDILLPRRFFLRVFLHLRLNTFSRRGVADPCNSTLATSA